MRKKAPLGIRAALRFSSAFGTVRDGAVD